MKQSYPVLLFLSFVLIFSAAASVQANEPLPSWNEGKARQAIIHFVEEVTKQGGANYIPPPERIATFDNDGTLWVEYPMYTQVLFAFERVRNSHLNILNGRPSHT